MNLIIDIGNTRTKIAIFQNLEIVYTSAIENNDLKTYIDILSKYPEIKKGILSSVKELDAELLNFLKKTIPNFHILDENSVLSFNNQYKTKNTLGKDRIAAIAGAHNIYPGQNVLVIDLGTAITYEFIDSNSNYLGGNISPGLSMRFKALNHFTDKLPLLLQEDSTQLIGNSTDSAITAGVQLGIAFEIDGFINQIKEQYEDLTVILTGGDANFFDKKIKNPIFVNFNLNLVGLNRILEDNVK